MTIIDQSLYADLEPCKLAKVLLQGSTALAFNFIVYDKGSKIEIPAGAKISVIVLYDPIFKNKKLEYKGSYTLVPDAPGYDVIVNEISYNMGKYSTVTVPIHEEMVTFAGNNEIILRVEKDDGKILYTFGLFYDVARNDGYFKTSVPNNLPKFENIQNDIKNIIDQQKLNTSDVADLNVAIKNKASKDLSNVGDFATAAEGSMFYKKNNELKKAPISIDDTKKIIKSLYSLNLPPNSLHFALSAILHANGGDLEYLDTTTGKENLIVKFVNDPIIGSKRPVLGLRGPKMQDIETQPDFSKQMLNIIESTLPAIVKDRQVQDVTFKFINPVTNFKFMLEIDGTDVAEYPAGSWNEQSIPGYNLGSGDQKIVLKPMWSSFKGSIIKLKFKADNEINMLGDGNVPYIKHDLNYISFEELAYMSDITAIKIRDLIQSLAGDERLGIEDLKNVEDTISGDYIKTKLEGLPKGSRLSLQYIDGVPTITGVENFKDLKDVPQDYSGQAGKVPVVKSTEDGLEFINMPVDIAETKRYAWEGRGVPTFPIDKPYNDYHFQIDVLPDSAQVLNIPSLSNGTLITVENNDRTDTMYLRPSAGETINGKSGAFRLDQDMLIYMVKQGTNWVVAFKGVFPNSMSAMKSTIKVLLDSLAQIHHFSTVDEMNKIIPKVEEIAIVDDDGNGFVGYYKYDVTNSKWINYPAQGLIMSDVNGAIPKLIKTVIFGNGFSVQQAGDQEDALLVNYTPGTVGTGEIIFTDTNTDKEFKSTKIKSMDKSIRIMKDPDGSADISRVSERNEGIHVVLGNDQMINSKFPKSKLYFSNVKVKGGLFTYFDMNKKSYVIQAKPGLDANIEGTTFLVALYFEPSAKDQKVSQNGNIQINLVDLNDQPVLDVNGDPMGAQIDYLKGQEIKKELYLGETIAKGFTEVHLEIKLNFPNEEIISVGANTQFCLQSISKDETSGPAIESFMRYTGYIINTNNKYYGFNSLNLARLLAFDEPETDTGTNKIWDMGDNLYLSFVNNAKVSIADYHLNIKDDGVNFPIWSIAKYYDLFDSHNIKNKIYKAKCTLKNRNDAFDVSILTYIGTDNIPPKPKLERYNNLVPIFTTDWISVDTLAMNEVADGSEHTETKNFNIPDAKSVAIILYPRISQIPCEISLKDFEGDIMPWFNKLIVTDTSHIDEKYLEYSGINYSSKVNTPIGYISYRYTCKDVDTPVPIGIIVGGKDVINNNAWKDQGAYDPQKVQGDFKFKKDGTVKDFGYKVQCFNEKNTENQVILWLSKVNDDGTFTEVAGSKSTFTIPANRKKPFYAEIPYKNEDTNYPRFSFEVKKDETYRMFMKSDKYDGFYIQSLTDGVPLFKCDFEFTSISETEKAITKLINKIIFTKSGVPVENQDDYEIKIDIDTNDVTVNVK